jgi:chromosome segregation ATPase
MARNDIDLPVIQPDLEEQAAPSCSPKIYVSNEEVALLDAMRTLRRKSIELKSQMGDADSERYAELESEIAALREQWNDLATEREKAFIRKMIMLGHLPPNHPIER